MMTAALLERTIALLGSLIVGGTATLQLRDEWSLTGLDAQVTKLLLGLMILGCVLAFLAALDILGAFA
jgi:hypothetical protein